MARSIYERTAHKELQNQGYLVDYKCRPFRVPKSYNVDFFGIGDLLYYDPKRRVLGLVAIKGREGVPSRLRKAVEDFVPQTIVKEIWTFKRDGSIKREVIP